MSPLAASDLMATLRNVLAARHSGQLSISRDRQPDGSIFVQSGRVAWVVAGQDRRRLADVLERRAGISTTDLETTYHRCVAQASNLAEEIVRTGLASLEVVREALREHNSVQLQALLAGDDGCGTTFIPAKPSYADQLLFQVNEILVAPTNDGANETTSVTSMDGTITGVHMDEEMMSNISQSLADVMGLDGAIACAIVDWESGMTLGVAGGTDKFDVELAASGNTSVVKAKMAVMKSLGITGGIEDILITLQDQYHLIRPITAAGSLFLYVAIDKTKGNLGLARHRIRTVEQDLKL